MASFRCAVDFIPYFSNMLDADILDEEAGPSKCSDLLLVPSLSATEGGAWPTKGYDD